MKNLSWAAYGLGVLIVVSVLMSGDLGVIPKSLIVAVTLFIGALIAAIHELARALVGSAKADDNGSSIVRIKAAR